MKYLIIKNSGLCGMCGNVWQILRAMWHHPNVKYYIDFTQNCLYKDSNITNTDNVWEYYFEQPHTNKYPESSEIIGIIDSIIDDPISEFRDVFIPEPKAEIFQNRREMFNEVIKKYIKLKPHIQDKIDYFVRKHFTNKKIIGVHFRGTDHPDKKEIKEYMQVIKEKAANYDLIFCSSDEEPRYKMLKAIFGEKVVSYNSIRSQDGLPLHYYDLNKYKVGEDVIIESYILSKTNFLFCCSNSNVNYLARAINPSLDYISL